MRRTVPLVAMLTLFLFSSASVGAQNAESFDWREDWAVAEGFALTIDTNGYEFPTSIAFVPNPGSAPDAPLYFVTEVRGRVKVVTNDRSVHVFAEGFFDLTPKEELPSGDGQVGLTGLCLEPEQGYVFVTFAYQDEQGRLRNNIMRFQSVPQTFSLRPTDQEAFTDIFLPYETGIAHQIGPCLIHDGLLYVTVGEAWQPSFTTNIDYMHGKLIRMTLDGAPLPDNPFYEDDDRHKARNYVWASGLRNAFGVKFVGDRIFAADNGHNIDRFIEIEKSENYLWNGNDRTIATNAEFVFSPSLAPVQMDFYSGETTLFPTEYDQNFFVALSAWNPPHEKIPGIMRWRYDLGQSRMASVPEYFVKWRGDDYQSVTGLAFGPDGLYFSPLVPNHAGDAPVIKVTYDPQKSHPYTTVQVENAQMLFIEKGCAGCHSVGEQWGFGGSVGPNLEADALVERLQARLNSDEYVASLDEIDKVASGLQAEWKAARDEVRGSQGMDRVRAWVRYRIQEPRFDTLYSAMPTLGVSSDEAAILADFLIGATEMRETSFVSKWIPARIQGRHLGLAFLAGGIASSGSWGMLQWVRGRRRGRRSSAQSKSGVAGTNRPASAG